MMIGFIASIVTGAVIFPPDRALWQYLLWAVACVAVLIVVCWFKGEPPRWRWGDP
jgi:hypothetical protein